MSTIAERIEELSTRLVGTEASYEGSRGQAHEGRQRNRVGGPVRRLLDRQRPWQIPRHRVVHQTEGWACRVDVGDA